MVLILLPVVARLLLTTILEAFRNAVRATLLGLFERLDTDMYSGALMGLSERLVGLDLWVKADDICQLDVKRHLEYTLSCSHCSVYSLDCLVAAIVHEKQWLFYTLCNSDRETSWSNDPGGDLCSRQRVTHPGYTRLNYYHQKSVQESRNSWDPAPTLKIIRF